MELIYRIALPRIYGVGNIIARLLVDYFGSAQKIFEADYEELKIIPGIGSNLLQKLSDNLVKKNVLEEAYTELEWCERKKVKVLLHDSEEFPALLKDCYDAPFLLFMLGNLKNTDRNVAVIGSRKSSHYGEYAVNRICESLAPHQVNIVSGLAYGIDTIAHQSALHHKLPTTAVLAHGLDRIYPASNRKLAAQIAEYGTLLTEYSINTNPDRENFPKRNRIVAGMSMATVVVEAGITGGALITADIAASYGREVFAVAGRMNDTFSLGCNYLIEKNKAMILNSGNQLLNELGWVENNSFKKEIVAVKSQDGLHPDEKQIIQLLTQKGNLSQQLIALHLQKPIQQVGAHLFNLELTGWVKNLPGNIYEFLP